MSQLVIEPTATVSAKSGMDEIFWKSRYTNREFLAILLEFQQKGTTKSKNAILEVFDKLAWNVARKYLNSGILKEDAYQTAILGLYAAANNFDTEKNGIVPFSSYARQAMFDQLNQQLKGYTIKIGTAASYHVWEIKKLMEKEGIEFDAACDKLQLSPRKRNARKQAMNAVGLSGISTEMEKTLTRGKNPTYEEVEKEDELRHIYELMQTLPPKYRKAVEMRIDGASIKEIAKALETSLPSVSNWLKKAYHMLSL